MHVQNIIFLKRNNFTDNDAIKQGYRKFLETIFDLVGNASSVFWLVIQHAPVELQRCYFPLFVQAAQRGDLARENIAMMDDRIAMFEGRPQRYGTQIVDGKLYQLLDPAKVDQWRHEMGMQPLADYLRQMGVQN